MHKKLEISVWQWIIVLLFSAGVNFGTITTNTKQLKGEVYGLNIKYKEQEKRYNDLKSQYLELKSQVDIKTTATEKDVEYMQEFKKDITKRFDNLEKKVEEESKETRKSIDDLTKAINRDPYLIGMK